MENKKVYVVVIVDHQEFWQEPTDYITTATTLDKAKKLLVQYLQFNEYSAVDFGQELNNSIEIWEQEIDALKPRITFGINLNELLSEAEDQIKYVFYKEIQVLKTLI